MHTIKVLVACTQIGFIAFLWVPDAYPGSISVVYMTIATNILGQDARFGDAVQMDKGFFLHNHCVQYGLKCVIPVKKQPNEKQFVKDATEHIQEVAVNRIVIEQKNGQAKKSARYLGNVVRLLQTNLASKLVRSVYLFQNFKPAFVAGVRQGRFKENRPCVAEIVYFGAIDEGLIDVRGKPELWGTKNENARFKVLSAQHESASRIEIGEIVLSEFETNKQVSFKVSAHENENLPVEE